MSGSGSRRALAIAVPGLVLCAMIACYVLWLVSTPQLQCVAYTSIGFGPTSGGYASVFVAWTALTAVFALGTMISLETQLAYGLRYRDAPAAVVQPRLEALAFYWTFLAGLSVAMWVVFYLV